MIDRRPETTATRTCSTSAASCARAAAAREVGRRPVGDQAGAVVLRHRRAEVDQHFATSARRHEDAVLRGGAGEPEPRSDAARRLRRFRGLADAGLRGRLGRRGWPGRHVRRGQHPRRRRVRARAGTARRCAGTGSGPTRTSPPSPGISSRAGSPPPSGSACRAAATAAC